MPDSALLGLSKLGFGISSLAHLALLALLVARSRGQGVGRRLLLAVAGEVAWAVVNILALSPTGIAPLAHGLTEAFRNFAWTLFLLGLLRVPRLLPWLLAGLILGPELAAQLSLGAAAQLSLHIMVAVVGLVCLEQVWRNTAPNRRWAMKFLCLALLAKFAFDLVMYSDALLFGRLDAVWWTARGYANALLVPLIAVAAARNRDWKLDVNVSRQVVFHSATLLTSGFFLLAVAIGGYILKYFGGTPGAVAATMLGFIALVALVVLLGSGTARSKLKVLLAKHFFSYRYDYRHEWLTLTRRLEGSHRSDRADAEAGAEPGALALRGLRSLADLVESPGGALWLKDETGIFQCEARIGHPEPLPTLRVDDAWLESIRNEEWILDLRGGADAVGSQVPPPGWLSTRPNGGFLVPLLVEKELVGLALLQRPRVEIDLDWEVRDLLGIAARQVASFLTLRKAVEALLQARQFESFNRMSAFVVHDLKNLVAQLSLMTANAERHQHNPAFQADMLETVRNVLGRMQGLLLQLGAGAKPADPPRGVAIAAAINNVARSRQNLQATIRLELDDALGSLEVTAHPERLERVLGHLLQNASEACGPDGLVVVRNRRDGDGVVIEITDNGQGMSEDFIRTQLFRPFSTTKAAGMGIGAFESRAYIRELGGDIDVTSRPQAGSTFIVRLPARSPARLASGADEESAGAGAEVRPGGAGAS